jgi:PEP-CTERM motif
MGSAARAGPVTSGDLVFDSSTTPIKSGSGRLDIVLFTGNAVGNPAGIPNPNGGMPGGGSAFSGDYRVGGDPETLTVQEVLDFLHLNFGPTHNELRIDIDINEPGAVSARPIQIDVFSITIGGTTLSMAGAVVLDAPDNGSGFSDFVIFGAGGGIDLTAFNPSDSITMHLEASALANGFEEFFISAAPEPGTMVLLGLGLGAMLLRK